MLNALYTMQGIEKSKRELADDAIYLERVLCNEDGGIQDQIASSFGGFNRIDFTSDGYTVTPVDFPQERKQQLENNLLLFFTGLSRFSFHIQKSTKKLLSQNTDRLTRILEMVDEAEDILKNEERSLDDFGHLLNETWLQKRGMNSEISTDYIDVSYQKAVDAGALGGKLLGAGGGGCLLFYVTPDKQEAVRAALCDMHEIKFRFENEGTKIICRD
jgi:D-glycero-alpha-D-manno-heptose-7-phosphate kinase